MGWGWWIKPKCWLVRGKNWSGNKKILLKNADYLVVWFYIKYA